MDNDKFNELLKILFNNISDINSKKFEFSDFNINEVFHSINNVYSEMYKFVLLYNDYIFSTHSYGVDIKFSMIEVHTLTYIEDNPGITSTELVEYWHKSKSSISQILKRLEEHNLIRKEASIENKRFKLLYVTEKGKKVNDEHRKFDIVDVSKTLNSLQKKVSKNDILSFFKVINAYNEVILKDFEINN
ncbi:MarR family transcriptional regulator [Peptoniphilus sp. SGI.035]|uniref:MarR family transcriptional regulator n=1 Tax=Peptoniphilus sp. SGI.035 TaxID=3420564 RepID=UPI003D005BA7